MRRIAIINQKGGVGKTTTTTNLGAALALQGRRVVLIDMDAQAHLSLCLNLASTTDQRSTYTVLTGESTIADSLRPTSTPNLHVLPSHIDLSGAEIELSSALGREFLLRDAIRDWEAEHKKLHGCAPADYLLFDCPPSLGLLSINALAACREVIIALQTEFLALQGMSKLVEILQVLRRRMNPEIEIAGILPCLYDSRLKLAREVLGEIRAYFPGQVFQYPIRSNVKLAEAPSFGKTIFEYAPDSNGAQDYLWLAQALMQSEVRDSELAGLPPFRADLPLRAKETSEPSDAAPRDDALPTHVLRPTPPPATREKRPVARVEEPVSPRSGDVHARAIAEHVTPEAPASTSDAPSSLHVEPRAASSVRSGNPAPSASVELLDIELADDDARTAVILLDEPRAAPADIADMMIMPAPEIRAEGFADAALAAAWDDLPDLPADAMEILDETGTTP